MRTIVRLHAHKQAPPRDDEGWVTPKSMMLLGAKLIAQPA
jgi:hypothetical protein